jgi:hypothetical protein
MELSGPRWHDFQTESIYELSKGCDTAYENMVVV